ncbi:MAG: lipoyl synthase [Actinomycetota bacterium]|nr:lipoyl synthase [Actinomycetota bacterium]
MSASDPLRVRWLGRVRYEEAAALQRALHAERAGDYLLLLEHPPVYTLGVRTRPEHLLASVASSGAGVVRADRGGDVTYHGPGQLVGYPVLDVPSGPGSIPRYVHTIEQLVIDVLCDLGLVTGRLDGYPGVWAGHDGPDPRKICAIGVRVDRGRSLHGFALNVTTDLSMFGHIVPCGIADKAVTSLSAEGVAVSLKEVVDAVCRRAGTGFAFGGAERELDRQDVAFTQAQGARPGRSRADEEAAQARPSDRHLAVAGVDLSHAVLLRERKPDFLRAPMRLGAEVLGLRSTLKGLGLATVCEEAGCPNLSECWADGTATFMINGERCTRACGFCLVDTRRPLPPDPGEPVRVAAAVEAMGLAHAVVTTVARDDLADGGAGGVVATIEAIRAHCPGTAVEVLISDCKGEESALGAIFAARPDVLNHNVETVSRLQRAARPSASYARSLAVLARAKQARLTTKSSIMVGLGETIGEVRSTLADLRSVGVDIVTIGQYLRPSAGHLPVARWWTPAELRGLAADGLAMGLSHVEASPLTRSSYHARQAAIAARSGSLVTAGGERP